MAAPRVLLVTTGGVFPGAVLEGLLGAGVPIGGVALPAPPPGPAASLPVEVPGAPPTVLGLARARGLAVACLEAGDRLPGSLAVPAPDLIVVACFPRRLPQALVRSARLACLNLHPSLLPRYRGPCPLFWQLRAGEAATGVTLHHVGEVLDAGAVVARRRVPLPDGASGAELERVLGEAGAGLVREALDRSEAGASLAGRPQDEARASHQPVPGPEDFEIPIRWSARRAFNFMRGTRQWGYPYTVVAGDCRWRLREAVGWEPGAGAGRRCVRIGDRVRLRFAAGVLEALPEGDRGC